MINLASIHYFIKKDYKTAENLLRRVIRLSPTDARFHRRLTVCLWEQNRKAESLAEAKLAESLSR